jgi:hypothetical protein
MPMLAGTLAMNRPNERAPTRGSARLCSSCSRIAKASQNKLICAANVARSQAL